MGVQPRLKKQSAKSRVIDRALSRIRPGRARYLVPVVKCAWPACENRSQWKFCGDTCRNRAQRARLGHSYHQRSDHVRARERERARMRRGYVSAAVCAYRICAREFTRTHHAQRYCEECRGIPRWGRRTRRPRGAAGPTRRPENTQSAYGG